MVHVKSTEALRNLLIGQQLILPEQWRQVEEQFVNGESVPDVLELMERRQILTSLQTTRILKGQTDGLVLGQYKLLYRNASGSFARVFRAVSLDGQKTVALKLLRERWASDPEAVAGFEREARICQRFVHPNIVPIYDVGSQGEFHYFTMEFVEGGNLRDFVRIRNSISPAEAAQCVYEICSGLEYALAHGATHRDLKLTNVLMSSNGVARLVDFGLAGAESPSRAGTSDGVHRALEYASLERGTNAPNNDPRTDIFFAGAIFYELLSGQSPWQRTRDREERKQLDRYTGSLPLRETHPNLPQNMLAIVEKMMQVRPEARYQTAGEVRADLRTALRELNAWKDLGDTDSFCLEDEEPFRLLIVDTVARRCEALKAYFAKHDFETTFDSSPETALNRLKGNAPPDGILFLADKNLDEVLKCYPSVQAYARSCKVPCLAVFAVEDRPAVTAKINSTRFGATAFQPATLREIRTHFEETGAITRQ